MEMDRKTHNYQPIKPTNDRLKQQQQDNDDKRKGGRCDGWCYHDALCYSIFLIQINPQKHDLQEPTSMMLAWMYVCILIFVTYNKNDNNTMYNVS
jgi:hypothetical protein